MTQCGPCHIDKCTSLFFDILQVLTDQGIDNTLLVVPEKDHFNLITELYNPTDTLTKVSYAHL